jgi:hypothetical protein
VEGCVKGRATGMLEGLTIANSTMELWVRGLGIERITAGWLKAYSWSRPSAMAPGRMCSLAVSQTMHPGDTWALGDTSW